MVKTLFVTAPKEQAEEIGHKLVKNRLAACVNVTSLKSFYTWKGELQEEDEKLLLIKTSNDLLEQVVNKIKDLHSYELPEILVTDFEATDEYLNWVNESLEFKKI